MRNKLILLSIALVAFLGLSLIVCLLGLAWGLHQVDIDPKTGEANGRDNTDPSAKAWTGGGPGQPAGPADPTQAGTTKDPTQIALETEPTGAAVILDGQLIGTAPLTLEPLPGSHSVRVEKDGFEASVVALIPGAMQSVLKITLAPVQYAELTVRSDPDEAEVLVDGEFRGRTPLSVSRLAPGPHELIVKKTNFSTHQSVQLLNAGEVKLIADIRLENKLLIMLEALLEQEPRSIGNWMELAHFYYIQNDMARAAAYFIRARELAVQPPPPLPADITEGEREAIQNEAQWDRSKLMGEIKKHLEMGPTYYGNKLAYDKFKAEYTARMREFDKWAVNWRDLHWIQNEAFARSIGGRHDRARELYLDYVTAVNPKSGVALGGLVKTELALGDWKSAEAHYALAKSGLAEMPAPPEEMKYREITWLDMARAWEIAVDQAPGAAVAERKLNLERAEECLTALDRCKPDSALTKLEAARARGQLFRLRGDHPGRVVFLTEALAAAGKTMDDLPATAPNRRFLQEDIERLRLQRAWAALAVGDRKLAADLANALSKEGVLAVDVVPQAAQLYEALRKNETPAEPKLSAAVEVVAAKPLPPEAP